VAVAVVHREVVPELGGESPAPVSLQLQGLREHLRDRLQQPELFLLAELRQGHVRRHASAVQDVVRVPPPYPGNGALVPEDGMDPPAILALHEEPPELFRVGLGT
jgi:hypothetical protein